jgi:D-tyrosyl-tRNA(Tyr) deacylase
MAELSFEETCPYGNTIKVSGYTSEVRSQSQTWHTIHNRHANVIAKAITEAKNRQYTTWPPPTNTPPLPDEMQSGTLGTVKQE